LISLLVELDIGRVELFGLLDEVVDAAGFHFGAAPTTVPADLGLHVVRCGRLLIRVLPVHYLQFEVAGRGLLVYHLRKVGTRLLLLWFPVLLGLRRRGWNLRYLLRTHQPLQNLPPSSNHHL